MTRMRPSLMPLTQACAALSPAAGFLSSHRPRAELRGRFQLLRIRASQPHAFTALRNADWTCHALSLECFRKLYYPSSQPLYMDRIIVQEMGGCQGENGGHCYSFTLSPCCSTKLNAFGGFFVHSFETSNLCLFSASRNSTSSSG